MKIYGIVAEYNPFHNGHKFQIDEIRKKVGDCAIVSVMSGNYVQRAETAVMSKYARAKAALLGGVDLVLELPMPYAISSAERFAYSSVHILFLEKSVETVYNILDNFISYLGGIIFENSCYQCRQFIA